MSDSDARIVYFAYGANVHPGWLRRRIPGAELIGTGQLPGYRLLFRKRGRDGAARSDACPCELPGATLPGALYRVQQRDLARLGAAGAGYHAKEVRVESASGSIQATTWIANPTEIEDGLSPWDWYVALIQAGAGMLELPAVHRAWLASVPTVPDPDITRSAPARAVLLGDRQGP